MNQLANNIHNKGLKFGLSACGGIETCKGYPGSLGKEAIDAQTLSDWGIDYLKYDSCNNNGVSSKKRFGDMASAL